MERTARGFTLFEAMVTVGILGVLAALSAIALDRAIGQARVTGNRYSVSSAVDFARSRAIAMGRSVYLIFDNVDQFALHPDERAPRVLVFDDPTGALAASPDDLIGAVEANRQNIREEFLAGNLSSTFFRWPHATTVPEFDGTWPPWVAVSRTARQADCNPAFCTFCERQGDRCVGAVRFDADGNARVITGPEDGSGGIITMVDASEHKNDSERRPRRTTLLISEPSGAAIAVRNEK